VDRDLATLARRVEMKALEREMVLIGLELKAMKADLQRGSGESRLLRLVPVWALRDLENSELRYDTDSLAQVANRYLFPILKLRYPEVIKKVANEDSTTIAYLNTMTDANLGLTNPSSYLEMAETTNNLLGRVQTYLQSARLPSNASTVLMAVTFPRPELPNPNPDPEDPTGGWAYQPADLTRRQAVWDGLLYGNRVTFTITPEDLFGTDGGLQMSCARTLPVIRNMGVFFPAPEETVANTWNDSNLNVTARANSTMTFATLAGPEIYEQRNPSWLGTEFYPYYGTEGQAFRNFPAYALKHKAGNGLSPIGSFDLNPQRLRTWSAKPLATANQAVVVFELETEPLSNMGWIQTCQ
jgi:hypothetical protein